MRFSTLGAFAGALIFALPSCVYVPAEPAPPYPYAEPVWVAPPPGPRRLCGWGWHWVHGAPQSLRNLGARPLRSELGEPATPRRALGGTVTEPTARGTAQSAARSTVIQSWIAINQIWRTRVQRYAQRISVQRQRQPPDEFHHMIARAGARAGGDQRYIGQPAAVDAFPRACPWGGRPQSRFAIDRGM